MFVFSQQRSRNRLHVIFAALIVCGGALQTAPAHAAGGLLEKLFGRAPAPQPVYAPLPTAPRAAVRGGEVRAPAGDQLQRKARKRTAKAEGGASSGKRGAVRPEVLTGPLGAFLRDPTLRRGDVVVTAEGLKVFTGQGGKQHADEDFVALAQGSRFVAGNSSKLNEIERANRHANKPTIDHVPAAKPQNGQRQAISETGKTL